ncbi:MAG: ribonuclease H-like domain-containing protein [Lachnospiraceae bacterium]|nr:ribonuclease H-like domain-containing protein [Lachnospiraceae bacterium]
MEKLAPIEKILFIDIETTGLSREKTNLYLIGCAYFDKEGYHTLQWFAESKNEEKELIILFTDYIKDRFELLIHYNGNHFDIPYLKYKADKYKLEDPFDKLSNFDIYAMIKPYKVLLGLPSLRQRCIEEFLGINSEDPYTGKELINVYRAYVHSPSLDFLKPLLFHNTEDLKGMAYILPILHYTSVKYMELEYLSFETHEFPDYMGNNRCELLINCRHALNIPKGFTTKKGQIMLSVRSNGTALLRLPVIEATLKQFFSNYKDYYYLPIEDCCVHKSVASGVDKNRRENAKKENCYTKYHGLFIPVIASDESLVNLPIFKDEYNKPDLYTPFALNKAPDIIIELLNDFVKKWTFD